MKFKFNTPNVEFVVNRFALVVKYLGILICLSLLCRSIYLLINSQEELASSLLIYSVIIIFATLSIYYILVILVNISLTFNQLYTKIDNFSLDRLINTLEKATMAKPNTSSSGIHPIDDPMETLSTLNETCDIAEMQTKIEDDSSETTRAYNSDIISLIKKGHIHMARHILVTERHMSLNSADSFIKSISTRG